MRPERIEIDGTGEIEERALGEIGQKYGAFRIVRPRLDKAMQKSLATYGQISPVVCAATPEGCELVDGFKRLRACRSLGKNSLTTHLIEMSDRASKAAMIQLNQVSQSLQAIEEGLIVQSLYRADGLTQPEIGVLLGRHKSWVCRRLRLIEQLDQELQQEAKLGLLPVVCGRELARLPRCNQKEALAAIRKHRLSTREVTKLVRHLLRRPRWEHALILSQPWELFGNPAKSSGLAERLTALRGVCRSVSAELRVATAWELEAVADLLSETVEFAGQTVATMHGVLGASR